MRPAVIEFMQHPLWHSAWAEPQFGATYKT